MDWSTQETDPHRCQRCHRPGHILFCSARANGSEVLLEARLCQDCREAMGRVLTVFMIGADG